MRNVEINYESVCPGIVYVSLPNTFILHDSNLHNRKAHFIEDLFSLNVLFQLGLYNPICLSLFKALD